MSDEPTRGAEAPDAAAAFLEAETAQTWAGQRLATLASDRSAATEALLARWMNDCIHGTVVSRDTEVVNYISTQALPELARRLFAAD
jgi:hypothetical protein